jgi:hypothetical protein
MHVQYSHEGDSGMSQDDFRSAYEADWKPESGGCNNGQQQPGNGEAPYLDHTARAYGPEESFFPDLVEAGYQGLADGSEYQQQCHPQGTDLNTLVHANEQSGFQNANVLERHLQNIGNGFQMHAPGSDPQRALGLPFHSLADAYNRHPSISLQGQDSTHREEVQSEIVLPDSIGEAALMFPNDELREQDLSHRPGLDHVLAQHQSVNQSFNPNNNIQYWINPMGHPTVPPWTPFHASPANAWMHTQRYTEDSVRSSQRPSSGVISQGGYSSLQNPPKTWDTNTSHEPNSNNMTDGDPAGLRLPLNTNLRHDAPSARKSSQARATKSKSWRERSTSVSGQGSKLVERRRLVEHVCTATGC